ncbi:mycofactocin-coupled SDR family oxidoreductase [Mycobacterium sp. EPa45]|uniref:mycofactocin-coupled SDR family oxidoreductase n=1 Tax=Mycobacterium sp. EPa45 TaxID=1545728 RepID=UPI0006426A00|nr:mycofactocin-coupled SDR family oxidoreductase [Mycobacterium sp. EPa45]AKK25486.1 3-ketoacyl-ACP reductase [Mycobacterium sp. EPa45]
MGTLDGRVAFITGAARGQGRSHAVRLAEEGAAIIAVDICAQIDSVPYPMSTPDDLDQTVKEVENVNGRIVAIQADVRDRAKMRSAYDAGTKELGPVDIVIANAGICPMSFEPTDQEYDDVVDVNLNGVYNTVWMTMAPMIARGRGGAVVITSSAAGLVGAASEQPGLMGYYAAKTGVIGLMRSLANYGAPHNIRVNCVAPTGVATPMIVNDWLPEYYAANPGKGAAMSNALPVSMIEPIDVSNAVLYLVSDAGRYVTGSVLPVDAGLVNKR